MTHRPRSIDIMPGHRMAESKNSEFFTGPNER